MIRFIAQGRNNPLPDIPRQMQGEIADGVFVLVPPRPDLILVESSEANFDATAQLPQRRDRGFQVQRFHAHNFLRIFFWRSVYGMYNSGLWQNWDFSDSVSWAARWPATLSRRGTMSRSG